jgi:type I restriction enzyme S subunit
MAGEWLEETLGDLSSYLNRGAAPHYVDEGGITVLNQKCVRDQRISFDRARRTDHLKRPVNPERVLQQWDILVNSTGVGTLGRVAQVNWLPEPTTVDSHITIVRPNPKAVDPRFLGFAIRALEADVEALGEGSTGQTELSRARLAALPIPLPGRSEQRAIAHILGSLDDKIELNRRMSTTLEAIVRALFKAWFVGFEPVRAKAEGRDPGVPPHLATLFPDRLVASELGEIPEGWEISSLGHQFEVVKGVSYKGSGLGESGIPLHNLNSIYEGGGYKYEGIKFYSGEYAERHVVRSGDVIVANTEQGHDRLLIGYAAIVPKIFGDYGIASHHIYRLRPKAHSPLTAAYICHLLNSPQMHDLVSGYANGTTVNMLPVDGVQKPLVVCPPAPLISAFDSLATKAEQRREEMVCESRTLAAFRDTLLPKLISGDLRVKDAETFLDRVQ